MIKKITHIAISFLLLAATTGILVSKHYCGDFMVGISLFDEADSCCDSDSCCHNETDFYQLDEDFSVSSEAGVPGTVALSLLSSFTNDAATPSWIHTTRTNITDKQSVPPPKIQTILSLKQSYLL